MMLRVAVRFCGVLVLLLLPGFSTSVRAQSTTYAIDSWVCDPSSCGDNYGPATTGAASTSIVGYCNNGDYIGPATAEINIVSPCTHPVILETSAAASNRIEVEQVGCSYISFYIGEISVTAAVLDTVLNTLIYNASTFVECGGGSSGPLPVLGSC
jgi:hypothetical protein